MCMTLRATDATSVRQVLVFQHTTVERRGIGVEPGAT